MSPSVWLVENRFAMRCICRRWTLYPKINFQPIRTCLTHTQVRGMTVGQVSYRWTYIALHSVLVTCIHMHGLNGNFLETFLNIYWMWSRTTSKVAVPLVIYHQYLLCEWPFLTCDLKWDCFYPSCESYKSKLVSAFSVIMWLADNLTALDSVTEGQKLDFTTLMKIAICLYWLQTENEPAHEIMALSVLRKIILQTRMRSHSLGLDVWFLVGSFVYFQSSCVRTAKALARLRRCAGSPEPSLVVYAISIIISWAGSNHVNTK